MAIENYSVLKGKPTAGKVVSGSSTHYEITVQAVGGRFTVAVNIQSTDGSEVLYAIKRQFTPPNIPDLSVLAGGMNPLASQPNGLAIDYVREQINGQPMISLAGMTLLPDKISASIPEAAQALSDAVTALIGQAIADGDATIYAFGSAFADAGKVDGIHDIHMNQGNPVPGSFAGDNGTWQDGAVFLQMPSLDTDPTKTWAAVFIAFQTESWNTDNSGNPI